MIRGASSDLPASGLARFSEFHPGLVALPGSQSVLESLGHPRRRFLPAEAPCRRALSPDSGRGGISLHLDRCSSPLATKGDA